MNQPRRTVLLAIATLAIAASAVAQPRVLGLLSLPEVFGPRLCSPFEPGVVALHAAPNDGKAFAFVRVDRNWSFAPHGGCEGLEVSVHQGERRQELPVLEYDYEMAGAIVLEHRDGWFRMRVVPSQPVRVLEIRGEWVRVEVLSNSACTAANDGPPEMVATGWLALHDSEGEPTVWFSSRGC